jgi:hypothetical protein
MSRGPGRIQKALLAIFEAQPQRRFTTQELAAKVLDPEPTASHIETVRQALSKLNLNKSRSGHPKSGGWTYLWGV